MQATKPNFEGETVHKFSCDLVTKIIVDADSASSLEIETVCLFPSPPTSPKGMTCAIKNEVTRRIGLNLTIALSGVLKLKNTEVMSDGHLRTTHYVYLMQIG